MVYSRKSFLRVYTKNTKRLESALRKARRQETFSEKYRKQETLSELQASQYKVKGGLYIVSDN